MNTPLEHPDKCAFLAPDVRHNYTVAYRLQQYGPMETDLATLHAELSVMRKAFTAALEDAARLDWLHQQSMQSPSTYTLDDLLTRTGWPDLRAAIDAARAKS